MAKEALQEAQKSEQGKTVAQKILASLKMLLSSELYEQIAEEWEHKEHEESTKIERTG